MPRPYIGFDDPQADPGRLGATVYVRTLTLSYKRGDLFNVRAPGGLKDKPGSFQAYVNVPPDDTLNGLPPWGSQCTAPCVPANATDGDADGLPDSVTSRHNQGMFAATYDDDLSQSRQQFPHDAEAGPSCVAPNPCDVYTQDCGGIAKFSDHTPTDLSGAPYDPYGASGCPSSGPTLPNCPDSAFASRWPVVPFPRDWIGSDTDSKAASKRLLRFASSIVDFNSLASHGNEYTLAEDAINVVTTTPNTPVAGAIYDAYKYFQESVIPDAAKTNDPAINCRNYIVVYITDGLETCHANACQGTGADSQPGNTGVYPDGGVSKDLGLIPLPDSPPGSRAAANALDGSINVAGVPVNLVFLGNTLSPSFSCIATNSGGKVFLASDRASLIAALESILSFKPSSNVFAAPAIPAFATGTGDSSQIGAVIPSHIMADGTSAQWAVWNGTVKSYKLASDGTIPVVTGVPATATPTPTGPPVPTPTPTAAAAAQSFPDESDPDGATPTLRKPVWSAGRMLGYTDPATTLAEGDSAAGPGGNAPAFLTVWPGRKMVWAEGAGSGTVPLTRQEFQDNGDCAGTCFDNLMTLMGLTPPSDVGKRTTAMQTVQFLRGGATSGVYPAASRDQVLNALGTYGTVDAATSGEQRYSYFYQDDIPQPGNPPQLFNPTDSGTPAPGGYAHKLGDIFHSEPLRVEPPHTFPFLAADVGPTGKKYSSFASSQSKRRRAIFVGANDGFLHAFDAGVWNRDSALPNAFDLGTGREIFAYAPSGLSNKFPNLLNFPPAVQYFVDGSAGSADVFIDTNHAGTPNSLNRDWKTVLVGALRQGGNYYYALDVTQPDQINAVTGLKTAPLDSAPDCLDGGTGNCPAKYPTVLWELTDNCSLQPVTCVANPPTMGETWSRPVVGRIQVVNGGTPEDRYVAILGGGNDPGFTPGTPVTAANTIGRAIYIVNVETGKIIYKVTQGVDDAATPWDFAPMTAAPAVADYNDDGYLDVVYIGDVNGRMWKLDITPDSAASRGVCNSCGTPSESLTGYQPFLLYDASQSCTQCNEPIFLDAGIIFVAGGTPPTLGVAFGTGNRSDLLLVPNPSTQRFLFVVDNGAGFTYHEDNLRDITPPSPPGAGPGPYNAGCNAASSPEGCSGFRLDFATLNERSVTSVFSTQGFLTLLTFTPDSTSPCGITGSSFQYRFFFVNGQGGYNLGSPVGDYSDYRESRGAGMAQMGVSMSSSGDIHEIVLGSNTNLTQTTYPASQKTTTTNWKEVNQ